MPDKETVDRAKEDAAEGKSASTQAGEFVREEMHHIRAGKHGARSPQQAIAIGLSKARRSGVKLPAPGRGKTSPRTRRQAKRDLSKGRKSSRPSRRRSRAVRGALKRESRGAASRSALSRQARAAARRRQEGEQDKGRRRTPGRGTQGGADAPVAVGDAASIGVAGASRRTRAPRARARGARITKHP